MNKIRKAKPTLFLRAAIKKKEINLQLRSAVRMCQNNVWDQICCDGSVCIELVDIALWRSMRCRRGEGGQLGVLCRSNL